MSYTFCSRCEDGKSGFAAEMSHSLGEKALVVLKERIVTQELRPGCIIKMRDAERLTGSSAIPVREALMRLSECGLVEHIEGKGFVVREHNLRDIDGALLCLSFIEQRILAVSMSNGRGRPSTCSLWAEGQNLLAKGCLKKLSMYDIHELVVRNDGARTTRNVGRILLDSIRTMVRPQDRDSELQADALIKIFENGHSDNRRKLAEMLNNDIDHLRVCAQEMLS